jgi:DNA-binding NtrC family response regulator
MPNRILLIDDDEIISEMVSYALSKSDLTFTFFSRLQIPDEYIDVDLVISDLKLSSSSGEETLTLVRNVFPETPLIIASGVEPINIDELKERFNVSGFIEKDDILDKLLSIIMSII